MKLRVQPGIKVSLHLRIRAFDTQTRFTVFVVPHNRGPATHLRAGFRQAQCDVQFLAAFKWGWTVYRHSITADVDGSAIEFFATIANQLHRKFN